MEKEIKSIIGEKYDGSFFEPITCLYNRNGEAWQLFKFEENVEYNEKNWYVVIIEKYNYDVSDIESVETVETVFEKYIEL